MWFEAQAQAQLRGFLVAQFNMAELRELAFDLGLNHETVPHDTLGALAVGLIRWSEDQGAAGMRALVQAVIAERGAAGARLVAWLDALPTTTERPADEADGPPHRALHQLRAPVADFVGRADEIARVLAALPAAGPGGAAAICGLRGLGGIGKTELAYAAAAHLAERFPDAQLVLDLRGASANPLSPAAALQVVIRAFAPEAKLPDDPAALLPLYRDALADRRVLILADDARDLAQVQPLLPPAGCALLVTSRARFALPGMAALDMGTLPAEDAAALLRDICPRLGAPAAELARLCGYLPLALRVSASLLANDDTRNIAHYLRQLAAHRLDLLRDPDGNPDDPAESVEASLRLSWDALDAAGQAALAQASVFAASFDRAAAAAVLALPEAGEDAETVLGGLYRRSLVEWDGALERYSLHDLVRAFAAARLADAAAAQMRHARHYATVARQADWLYLQGGDGVRAGLALFDGERAGIDAGWAWARGQAPGADPAVDALLVACADATAYVGELRYRVRDERIPQLEAARVAAGRLGRKDAEGWFLGNLGIAYAMLGEARRALGVYEQQLAITRAIGDRRGEGVALGNLGSAYYTLGEARRAIEYHEQALPILRAIGDRRGEGQVLGNLGSGYYTLGEMRQATGYYEQVLTIMRVIGDRRGEGQALGNLGIAYAALGEAGRAIGYYEQALTIKREIGDRDGEAKTSWNLGLALEAQGDLAGAVALMQACVDFEREIGHPHAEPDAARVAALRARAAGAGG